MLFALQKEDPSKSTADPYTTCFILMAELKCSSAYVLVRGFSIIFPHHKLFALSRRLADLYTTWFILVAKLSTCNYKSFVGIRCGYQIQLDFFRIFTFTSSSVLNLLPPKAFFSWGSSMPNLESTVDYRKSSIWSISTGAFFWEYKTTSSKFCENVTITVCVCCDPLQ